MYRSASTPNNSSIPSKTKKRSVLIRYISPIPVLMHNYQPDCVKDNIILAPSPHANKMTTDGHAALPDTQTEKCLRECLRHLQSKGGVGFASKAKSLRMDVTEGSGFLHPWVSSEVTISETVCLFFRRGMAADRIMLHSWCRQLFS